MFIFICPHCHEGLQSIKELKTKEKGKKVCPKCDKIIEAQDYWRGFDLAAE